ncbi:cysteine hydrolase [Methylobacterium sp. P1-11]|uniref:cysteine hydrolase n=1 Tax=Methylobacterium sp. P1-11 TaxID=2024616 RepID=UPI0011EBA827|nr:cysteine hydrolase [Methylobacterium sp. P1-11]KAA0116697.1 cysteine hydrolase [Methylobacterium sp. P1-11]
MINRLLNAATGWYVRRGLRAYHHFPADKTAVILVDAQRAFVDSGQPLSGSLAELARWARARKFAVVHAPIAMGAGGPFKTPAHRRIEQALAGQADGPGLAPAVGPSPGDIVLPARKTLSIFGLPETDALIEARGFEHLILAGPLADLTLDSSLRDAAQRDVHVTVVSDCVAASTPAALELEVRHTMPRYAHLVTGLKDLERRVGG